MTKKWFIQKINDEGNFTQWDGTNIDEFNDDEFLTYNGFIHYTENGNGGLDVASLDNVVFYTIPLGEWWGGIGIGQSYVDPFVNFPSLQEIPAPGYYKYELGEHTPYE